MKQEEALVLLLSRLDFDEATKVRIFHLIKNGVDWYEFLNICVKKKLICMVYSSLIHLQLIQLLPMIIINNMQYHYEQNLEQNQKFLQVATDIMSHFKKQKILIIPVKGLRFLKTIYNKEPAVRILNDIDFITSANNQLNIHEFMKNSGYHTYLINDRDAFCSTNSNIKSCFYIKFEESNPYGKLRIDFDFSCPDKWIEQIQRLNQPIYEFLYLCNSYYTEAYTNIKLNDIATYSYVKLVDIHEYYHQYLSSYSNINILDYADQMKIREQTLFTLTCINNIYKDMYSL